MRCQGCLGRENVRLFPENSGVGVRMSRAVTAQSSRHQATIVSEDLRVWLLKPYDFSLVSPFRSVLLGQGTKGRPCCPRWALAPDAGADRPGGLRCGPGPLFDKLGPLLHAPEEEQGGPALGFREAERGWRDRAVGVALLRVGLAIEAVLHEEVHHFTHRVGLHIGNSDLEQDLHKLAAADVRRRAPRSPSKSRGDVLLQLLHRHPCLQSDLRSSGNDMAPLAQVKREVSGSPQREQPV